MDASAFSTINITNTGKRFNVQQFPSCSHHRAAHQLPTHYLPRTCLSQCRPPRPGTAPLVIDGREVMFLFYCSGSNGYASTGPSLQPILKLKAAMKSADRRKLCSRLSEWDCYIHSSTAPSRRQMTHTSNQHYWHHPRGRLVTAADTYLTGVPI